MSEKSDLLEAIRASDLAAVREIIADGCNLEANGSDDPEHVPQLVACANGTVEIVQAIFGEDANPYDINNSFESYDDEHRLPPLAVALLHGNEAVARWLVEHGANVNARYQTNKGTIETARTFGNFEHGRIKGVCWWLASMELLDFMLTKGLDLNATDIDDCTALVDAICCDDANRVRSLLAIGADPDALIHDRLAETNDLQNVSVLVFASYDYGRSKRILGKEHVDAVAKLDIIKQLVRAGASLSTEFPDLIDGMEPGTVMDWALWACDDDVVELFGLQLMRAREREDRAEYKALHGQ